MSLRFSSRAAALTLALFSLAACGTRPPVTTAPPAGPRLGPVEIAALIGARIKDRELWAQAIADALAANALEPDPPSVCAVVALVAQESSFQADPVVPGLAKLVEARLEGYRSKLGPLGRPVFQRLLSGRAPANPRTFEERLAQVRTEHDLDLVFRDLLAYFQGSHPAAFEAISLGGKLFDVENLSDLNPITTAGPMQVSVRFAESWAREHHARPESVRDELYTRAGGVYYGTARLFAHRAGYARMLFRFADYNAGFYASRNAALQEQLMRLVGKPLVLDGDLLRYDKHGAPLDEDSQSLAAIQIFRQRYAPALEEREMREDLRLEKTLAFETTATFVAIKSTFRTQTSTEPVYAIVPQVTLESPKLSRPRSTAWFAESVDRRFQACLGRAPR